MPGIYLAYDYSGHDPRLYHTAGSLAAFAWASIEPEPDHYDFGVIDRWLTKLSEHGLKGAFFVHVLDGGCNGDYALPRYVREDDEMALRRHLGYTCDRSGRTWKAVPNYINARFQERLRRLIMRLGARYQHDPRVEFVAIGTGIYGETRAAVEKEDRVLLRQAGLTSERWVAFVNRVGEWYRQAFSDASGNLQKPLLQQTGAITFHTWERRAISEKAIRQGIGLSLNLMHPDAEGVIYSDADICPMCGWYDFPLQYWESVPTAWEAYELQGCTPELLWWGVYNMMSKHPVYLRVAARLVRTPDGQPRVENIAPFAWAAPFMGVTAQTSPAAWVALREHRDPVIPLACVEDMSEAPHRYPQWGNYGFFMDQLDNLPGGHTIPETNDPAVRRMKENEHPYNPALPPGKEGWAVRRTDEQTGNSRMYFAVDDAFAYGNVGQVEVRVTYWDHGYDAWQLLYMDESGHVRAARRTNGETVVHKMNTGTWRTVSLYLERASLSNGLPLGVGGADFYIDSMEDGNEWIHFVEVRRPSNTVAQEPTPSPTPNPTQPPPLAFTPTPTPRYPKTLIIPYTTFSVHVDGQLSEWASTAPMAVLDVQTADTVYGDPDQSDARVIMKAAWNEEGMYLAFWVKDEVRVADSADIWRDDSIEIGVDANHDHHFTWDGPDFQFTIAVDGRWARLGKISEDPHIKRAVQHRVDGWNAEIHVPWSVLRIPPGTPGRVLGFTFAYHDDNDGDNWDVYMVWAGERTNTSDEKYADMIMSLAATVTPTPTPQPPLTPESNLPCYRGVTGGVFWDANHDGVWQEDEVGIGGMLILLQGMGRSLSTITRDTGTFALVGVPPGRYYLAVEIPEGHTSTTANPRIVEVPLQRCARVTGLYFGVR